MTMVTVVDEWRLCASNAILQKKGIPSDSKSNKTAPTNKTQKTNTAQVFPLKKGHLAENCPEPKKCSHCGRKGHLAKDCWEKHPEKKPAANPPRNRGYFSRPARALCIENYNISRPILHSNIHQVLHLPRKVTLEPHQVLHLPHKMTLELHQILRLPHKIILMIDTRHRWNVIYNARSNRCHPATSPIILLDYYLTRQNVIWLFYYSTITWLDKKWFDSSITWLDYYLTLLLLDSMIWLFY